MRRTEVSGLKTWVGRDLDALLSWCGSTTPGASYDLSALPSPCDPCTPPKNESGLSYLFLPYLPANIQRAQWYPVQFPWIFDRYRTAGCLVATTLQTQPARSGRNVPHA